MESQESHFRTRGLQLNQASGHGLIYDRDNILHLLGNEGPKTADPNNYIWYIYNPIVLENATVRASAASALARFGAVVESLQPRILVPIRRCLYDNDDEVQDRATLYLNFVEGERVHISVVPKEVKNQSLVDKKTPASKKAAKDVGQKVTANGHHTSASVSHERLMNSIPEFGSFGKLFKVSVVVVATTAEDFTLVGSRSLASLPYGTAGQSFVAFQKPEGLVFVDKFTYTLKFLGKEVDPTTGDAEEDGYEDDFQLEELEEIIGAVVFPYPKGDISFML